MQPINDVIVVGGGLAGLCNAIQLAQKGFSVVLIEKKDYPFHRVCGEYIALESWDFLQHLGVPLEQMQLPLIQRLLVSAPNGSFFEANMKTGGFGISRYTLDAILAKIAIQKGVTFLPNTQVNHIEFKNQENIFEVQTHQDTLYSKVVCGCYGKRSNLDIQLKRDFVSETKAASKVYVGVKYHLHLDFPNDMIALHNFSGGYCGISKVDDERFCLCYLTESQNFTNHKGSIPEMEKNVLWQNPFLKKYLTNATFLYEKPLTISQISFANKPLIENHILMAGDSAGMITPLCGNGMTMAMQASKILANLIETFLKNKTTRSELEESYQKQWNAAFGLRMRAGRNLQKLFGRNRLTNTSVALLRNFPALANGLIRLTHGKPY